MSELPPAKEVFAALRTVAIPAAGAAALAFALLLMAGRWVAAFASGVAVLAGFAFANWQREYPLLPWVPGEKTGDWLMLSAALLVAVGLVTRWIGLIVRHFTKQSKYWWLANATVWLPRAVAVVFVSGWVMPKAATVEEPYLRWVVAAGTLLAWFAFDSVSRAGCSNETVFLLAFVALHTSGLMLFARTGSYSEMAMALGFSLLGVAVVGTVAKVDSGAALPAALGFLPGLIVSARFLTTSDLTVEPFWLMGLAPLALVPFLLPALSRKHSSIARILRLLLIAIPAVVALYLADRTAPLKFGEEW